MDEIQMRRGQFSLRGLWLPARPIRPGAADPVFSQKFPVLLKRLKTGSGFFFAGFSADRPR